MLSVIFSRYIRYTTISAYYTDIRVISVCFMFTPCPDAGSNLRSLDTLPTELLGPLSLKMYINFS